MARRYFRLRRLILGGLVFAAIAVPLAQAKHGDSGFWTERPVSTQVSAQDGMTPAVSQTEAKEWRARLDSYQRQSDRSASSQAPTSRGFDWTDAGIGAAVVFGAAVLLLWAVALGRRFRSHAHPAGIAQA
jgi:hypothetical protein